MKTATNILNERMLAAMLSDDGMGYPNNAAFVASDVDGFADIVMRTLEENTPTVIVLHTGVEFLYVPAGMDDDGGIEVDIYWRQIDAPGLTRVARRAHIDRDDVQQQHELALA